MLDMLIDFFKTSSEWGISILGIVVICVTVTFITLTGFTIFLLIAKLVWTSMFGGTKSTESIQYTLLKQLLVPIVTSGGKDLAKAITDKLDDKESKKSVKDKKDENPSNN